MHYKKLLDLSYGNERAKFLCGSPRKADITMGIWLTRLNLERAEHVWQRNGICEVYSRSDDAVIGVYDAATKVIEMHERPGELKE